jgi:hypothetical protein
MTKRKTRRAFAELGSISLSDQEMTKASRSRLSNGRGILPNVDGRSPVARRYRDIAYALASDQGGSEHLSEARTQLIRRFAAAAVIAEQREATLANGGTIDIAEHALLCSTLCKVAKHIGIDRRARNIVPNIEEYLKDDPTTRTDDPAYEEVE